ncbi:HAAS signaling domain-containing protein [Mycetocola saprophilus]|uniref:HAAS signaling domain-containing protein n=1 Tax=Mycetocola saprophilus TaxID=76636 RepID=UPI0004C2692E|nr:hypothetical protein [Mycetocola saprophilus]
MTGESAIDRPLVAAYLRELDLALAGADPRERAETLAAIEHHVSDALAEDNSPEATRRVLAELGSPSAIAGAASPLPSPQPTSVAPQRDRFATGALTLACGSIALMLASPLVAVPLALITIIMSIVHVRAPGANRRYTWLALGLALVPLILVAAYLLLFFPPTGNDINPGVPGFGYPED